VNYFFNLEMSNRLLSLTKTIWSTSVTRKKHVNWIASPRFGLGLTITKTAITNKTSFNYFCICIF